MKYIYWLLGLILLAIMIGWRQTKPQQTESQPHRLSIPDVMKSLESGVLQPLEVTEYSLLQAGGHMVEFVSIGRDVVLLYSYDGSSNETLMLRTHGRKLFESAFSGDTVRSVTFYAEPTRYDHDIPFVVSGQLHDLFHAVRSAIKSKQILSTRDAQRLSPILKMTQDALE